MIKILFIAVHRPFRSPSQRFRFDQFMDFFSANACEITYSSLISEADDVWFYHSGHTFKKVLLMVKSIFKRMKDVRSAHNYDLVFVQREAIMLGTSYFERKFAKKSKLVFDFDDSIWLLDVSEANKKFGWLKRPQKTAEIIGCSKVVFAGNEYLANYAHTFNSNVLVVPTVLKTVNIKNDYASKTDNLSLIIGWIGSTTTIKHIEWALPILKACKDLFGNTIKFVIVSDKKPAIDDVEFEFLSWSHEVEHALLTTMDIGIMPLPDDEWTRGKCGFKGLQCMSYGIPVVMSAVGVNNQIIQPGVNGFLAHELPEWIDSLSKLVHDKTLRIQIGEKGKQTIQELFSAEKWQESILDVFRQITHKE